MAARRATITMAMASTKAPDEPPARDAMAPATGRVRGSSITSLDALGGDFVPTVPGNSPAAAVVGGLALGGAGRPGRRRT